MLGFRVYVCVCVCIVFHFSFKTLMNAFLLRILNVIGLLNIWNILLIFNSIANNEPEHLNAGLTILVRQITCLLWHTGNCHPGLKVHIGKCCLPDSPKTMTGISCGMMRKQTIWLGWKNLTQCKWKISTAQIKVIEYDRFYKSPNRTGNWPELMTVWWEGLSCLLF